MKLLSSVFIVLVVSVNAAVRFSRSDVGNNGFTDDVLVFRDRLYVPYGPDRHSTPPQDPSDQPWTGYGYGLVSQQSTVSDITVGDNWVYLTYTPFYCTYQRELPNIGPTIMSTSTFIRKANPEDTLPSLITTHYPVRSPSFP